MSDSTADQAASDGTEAASSSSYWPDETVDAISALVVVTAVTLGLLWFVMNG